MKWLLGKIINLVYKKVNGKGIFDYLSDVQIGNLLVNALFQKIFFYNKEFNIPIHFTSRIVMPENLTFQADSTTLKSFCVSGGAYIQAINEIYLGKNFLFAPGLKLVSANHETQKDGWIKTEPIIIGDNVWIGANVVILPGVKIGNNCIVGAGSIVNKSIEGDGLVIAGNPAKIIRRIDEK